MPNVNGTTYHHDTPAEVVRILEAKRMFGREGDRIKVSYGDTATGRQWDVYGDEYGCEGYVHRSGGTVKIPLLVHNRRSFGGPGMLEHCIIRIVTARGKRVLWQHPSYHVVSNNLPVEVS